MRGNSLIMIKKDIKLEYLMTQLKNIWNVCYFLILNLVSWLTLLVLLPVFLIYRKCIDIVLRIWLGSRYGGLLNCADTLMCIEDASKLSITTVLYVKSDKKLDIISRLKKVYQEKVFDHPELYPKLTSSKHSFGGYPYWIKNSCDITDVLRPIQLPNNLKYDEEYLKEISGKTFNDEYLKNDSILWEIHAAEEPLEVNHKDDCYHYPVICRFHHLIGDGTSLMALLIRVFADNTTENYGDTIFSKTLNGKKKQNAKTNLLQIPKLYVVEVLTMARFWLELIFLALGRITYHNILKPLDVNALHSLTSSKDKIAAWTIEENVECIPIVKKIKNRAHTQFTRVVITAILASMKNYFKRNSFPYPKNVSGAITQLLYYPSTNLTEPVKLQNKTGVSFFELSFIDDSKPLIDSLGKVTENMSDQIRASDIMIGRFVIGSVLGCIPPKLFSPYLGFQLQTFVLTNVPGGAKMKVLDGCVLDKIVPLAPNLKSIGVTFTILSYDNRLQVGVLVGKTLVQSQREVQTIADDVLGSIKAMDEEFQKYWVNA